MSDLPPESEPLLDAVLQQLQAALEEAGVTDPQTQEALADGVRAALGGLEVLGSLEAEARLGEVDVRVDLVDPEDPQAGGAAGVTVVDGGLGRDQPRVRRPRPDLRVAPGQRGEPVEPDADDPAATAGGLAQGSFAPASEATVVRFDRVGGGRPGTFARYGRIEVPADGRQAVFLGQAATAYRLGCNQGRMAVSVDGITVETLSPGQSMDVEGRSIVVLAADESPCAGLYARL